MFSAWIFLHRYFLTILSWLQSSYIKEKFFVAASILYGCGYFFLLWKGLQNDAHCNYIKPPYVNHDVLIQLCSVGHSDFAFVLWYINMFSSFILTAIPRHSICPSKISEWFLFLKSHFKVKVSFKFAPHFPEDLFWEYLQWTARFFQCIERRESGTLECST